MSPRFFLLLRKWPQAVQQALSFLSEGSCSGKTSVVDFQMGPPSSGRLPLWLLVDGQRTLLGKLSDTNPGCLLSIRSWMERCLELDREGTLHPELLTLDCYDAVLSFVLIHVGWEERSRRARPVSFLVIIRSDRKGPLLYCFCDALEMISNLYRSITRCLHKYRASFDNSADWYDVKRYDHLSSESTTERLLEQVRSQKIERFMRNF